MMRSVTAAILESRAMKRPLLVPADAVSLGERDCGRWPPRPSGILLRAHALFGPGGADAVYPHPLGLNLVAAHEQGRIALDQVEQQPLVGDPPAILAERIGEADVERDLAQPHSGAIEARRLGHKPEL